MGGNGDIIEIDESYMRGRRKANKGRYLVGNRLHHRGTRRNNYKNKARGPWVFGLLCRRTGECRVFWVPDRKAKTLIPLIKENVVPGSVIYSDEWMVYKQLKHHGYHHDKVNHSVNFVNPLNGGNTQRIERQWQKLKLRLLKIGPGIAMGTIHSQLTHFWWQSINGKHACPDPFSRLVDVIVRYY